MQHEQLQRGLPTIDCTAPIKCSWNLLPSILALSILVLFSFFSYDVISRCQIRMDLVFVQQLLIWQFYLILVSSDIHKHLLEYFKNKGLEYPSIIIPITIACFSPLVTFTLMFRFQSSCNIELPAYFVTVYWIFASMTMLFSLSFMYYALKPSFVELNALLGIHRASRLLLKKDLKIVSRFPRMGRLLQHPGKSHELWKECLLLHKEFHEQERYWRPWDYQHLVYFFSHRVTHQELRVVNVTLKDVLHQEFFCYNCREHYQQLDYVFIHPVLMYLSHADCLLKSPTNIKPIYRYKFWRLTAESFYKSKDHRKNVELANQHQSKCKNISPEENQRGISGLRFGYDSSEDADPELNFRLSLLVNEVPAWLASVTRRLNAKVEKATIKSNDLETNTKSVKVKPGSNL
jgi:hypothetical protein